jgi:hypothetical protein
MCERTVEMKLADLEIVTPQGKPASLELLKEYLTGEYPILFFPYDAEFSIEQVKRYPNAPFYIIEKKRHIPLIEKPTTYRFSADHGQLIYHGQYLKHEHLDVEPALIQQYNLTSDRQIKNVGYPKAYILNETNYEYRRRDGRRLSWAQAQEILGPGAEVHYLLNAADFDPKKVPAQAKLVICEAK